MESFVDLAYRGLSLGRRVKLTQVRPTTGYLETPAPMPVGTTISIATDDGPTLEAIVTAIHEQVGGSEKAPGMTVKPALSDAGAAWWKERVALPEEAPPPPPPRTITVRPRSNTVVEDHPAGATVTAAASPRVTAPMPAIAPSVDPAMVAALAAASQTVAQASVPEDAGGRTIVMQAMTPEALEMMRTSDELPVARISDVMAAASVEPEVQDDGKKTTMMAAVDLSALGLEVPGTTGQMAAVKGDEDGDDEPEPPSRPSQPAMPSSVKKRKKRR